LDTSSADCEVIQRYATVHKCMRRYYRARLRMCLKRDTFSGLPSENSRTMLSGVFFEDEPGATAREVEMRSTPIRLGV
jgi:hypothetical protein